jgi:hypothetical protein
VPKALQVPKEQQEHKVLLVRKVPKVYKVHKVQQELKVLKEI